MISFFYITALFVFKRIDAYTYLRWCKFTSPR
jgi:hypothetical protein